MVDKKTLGSLLKKHPSILKVLDKHGVHFCAGCYLTLFSPVKLAAAYHAVPNVGKFMSDLKKAMKR